MTTTATAPPSLDDLDPQGQIIVRAVAAERAARHRGPTWAELRAALGEPPPPSVPRDARKQAKVLHKQGLGYGQALREAWPELPPDPALHRLERRLRWMRRHGWIEFSTAYRSLDVGPTLREAFRAARQQRDEAGGIVHMVAVVVLALMFVGLVASHGLPGAWHEVTGLVATGWHTVGAFIATHKPAGGTS